MNRKEQEKAERSEAILNAAQTLFFENGYKNTTVEHVAKKAGFAKGTVYLYYSSKEELQFKINIRGVRLLTNYLEGSFKVGYTGIEVIKAMGYAYRDFALSNTEFFALMNESDSKRSMCCKLSEENNMRLEEENKKGLDVLIKAIVLGIKDGSLQKNIDPITLAIQLWASLRGLLSLQIFEKESSAILDQLNFDNVIINYINLIERGIKA